MKPLISLVALALGFAAVSVVVKVQQDPFAFTRLQGHVPHSQATAVQAIPVRAVLEPSAVVEPSIENTTVFLEETEIVGRAPVRHRPTAVAPDPEPEVTVLPAPCTDGEYRLIDEHRGVRLMCHATP